MTNRNIEKVSVKTYSNHVILRISLTISFLLSVIIMISSIYAAARDLGTTHILSKIFNISTLYTFLVNTFIVFILLKFHFWVVKKNSNSPKKVIWKGLLGSFILSFILSIFSAQATWYIFSPENTSLDKLLTFHFFGNLIILIITILITVLLFMRDKEQRRMLEFQKLSIENLQNRYEALKNQVDPHFLFNSLNTLNGLIGYDDHKAHDYLEQLSSVFRYTIQNKNIVYLEDELNLIKSYIHMMEIRYSENLQVESHIDNNYLKYYILSFGLQLLIENCIKHNVISDKYPLLIIIETTENEMIRVKNSVHLRTNARGSNIGLSNLDERYQLVFGKEIKIYKDENFFTVEIPLIKDIKKYLK